MRIPWNSATRPALLFTLVLMIFVAIFLAYDRLFEVATGGFWEGSTEEYADSEMQSLDESIERTVNAADRFSPVAGGSVKHLQKPSQQSEQDPVLVAKRLAVEMRQIIRAGRSMKSLRATDNDFLRRRCQVGMDELHRWTNSVAERERRLPLPASVLSMRDVYTYTKICTSCRSDASQYCDLAEKALAITQNSLGK